MGRLRKAGRWLSTTDAGLSMAERIGGWIISGSIGGILSTAGGTVIGWLAGNIFYGLLIGMGVGYLVLMGAAVKAIRVAGSDRREQPNAGVVESAPEAKPEIEASLPYARPRPLTPGQSSAAHLSDLSFRAVDLITPEQAMGQTIIRDKTFYRCTIHGPVLANPRDSRFVGTTKFYSAVPQHERPDDMLYSLDSLREPNPTRT
jgi:hypothetical protein